MAETDSERLERVLVIAGYSESYDAILLATEVNRLRRIETALKTALERIEADTAVAVKYNVTPYTQGRVDVGNEAIRQIREALNG